MIRNTLSEGKHLDFGVPQGSCDEPVFCKVYANSLGDIVSNHSVSVVGYADDHALYVSLYLTIQMIRTLSMLL